MTEVSAFDFCLLSGYAVFFFGFGIVVINEGAHGAVNATAKACMPEAQVKSDHVTGF